MLKRAATQCKQIRSGPAARGHASPSNAECCCYCGCASLFYTTKCWIILVPLHLLHLGQLEPVAQSFVPQSGVSFKVACVWGSFLRPVCVTELRHELCLIALDAQRVDIPRARPCMHGRPEKTSAPSTTSMPPNTRPAPPLRLHRGLLWTNITCVRVPRSSSLHRLCHTQA